jgi:hypothetical protein
MSKPQVQGGMQVAATTFCLFGFTFEVKAATNPILYLSPIGVVVCVVLPWVRQNVVACLGARGTPPRRGVSENGANRVATPQRWFSTWDYGFGLAWELDFWGRFRRAIEAAEDSLDASVQDYDDVLVLLISDVGSN